MIHNRVQRALDGELPLDQLEPAEAELYHEYRQAFTAALRPLEARPDVDVAPAVLQALAAPGRRFPTRAARHPGRNLAAVFAGWVWTPRTFTARPAFGLAAAALAVLVWVTQSATPGTQASASNAAPRIVVEFRLAAPDAGAVSLVGDFNAWRPEHQLRQVSPGVWAVSVALEPGVYHYGFMVDGATLRLDPLAPKVADGFGGESSRLAVLAPQVRT